MAEEEIIGRGSINRVWVSGETIRRERGQHSNTIARLLTHLERRGFAYAPRHLGIDDRGRDILSKLPGVPVPKLRGEEQLNDVGRLTRAVHDAVSDFELPHDARWRYATDVLREGEIIIHSDIAPWNLLEQDEVLTGLVDWDTARPGRPIEDVAYVAWHFVPLHGELMGDGTSGPELGDRPRRLRVLLDAYGLDDQRRATLLSNVARMQVEAAARVAKAAEDGDLAMRRHWNEGRFAAATARSLIWLDENRTKLSAAM